MNNILQDMHTIIEYLVFLEGELQRVFCITVIQCSRTPAKKIENNVHQNANPENDGCIYTLTDVL